MNSKEQIEEKVIKKDKSKILKTTSLVLILLIAIIGISYAAYNWAFTGQTNTLSTSDINLEFIESNTNIINIQNALPMGCTEGKQQTETFDFSVTSTTTRYIDIVYTLNIEKLEVDSGYTQLQDNQIALYLTDYTENELLPSSYDCPTGSSSGEVEHNTTNPVDEYKNIKPMLLTNTDTEHISLVSQLNNYKLYSGKHRHDSSHQTIKDKFKLRVWIAGDVDASSWNANTKLQYKFKIGLTSEEKQRSAYPEVVYRYGPNEVNIGDPIVQETKQGYCANHAEWGNSCDFGIGWNTEQECQDYVTNEMGGEATCQTGSWTTGFDYVEDYTTLNKNFFLKHNISSEGTVESSEVCYILNSTLYCLKGGDGGTAYSENTSILQNSFGQSNCSVNSSSVGCSVSGLDAGARQSGRVFAGDGSSTCRVDYYGNSGCIG